MSKKSSQDFFDKLNSSRCEMQRELFGVVVGNVEKRKRDKMRVVVRQFQPRQ